MSNVWVLVDSSHWCVPHVNPLPGFHGNSGTVARSGQRKPGTQLIAHRLTSCRPDFCDAVLISLRLSLSSLSDAWQFHFVIGYCVWCDLISPKSLKITQVHILHLCLLEFGLLKKYKKTSSTPGLRSLEEDSRLENNEKWPLVFTDWTETELVK